MLAEIEQFIGYWEVYIRGKLFHDHIDKKEDAGSDESIVVQAVYRNEAYPGINA